MTLRRDLSLLAAFAVFSSSAFGYIRQMTNVAGDNSPVPLFRTDNTAIPFLLNVGVIAGLQSSATGKNVTVISPQSNPVAATQAALATWNAVSTANISFLPLRLTDFGIDPNDGNMVIAVGSSPSDVSAVGGAYAVTIDFYNPVSQAVVAGGPVVPKGAILDSDIILNPGVAFSTDGSTSADLQSVLTHELGHSLSANHTGVLGASMFQFNYGLRFLTSDDMTFVNTAYPLSGGPTFGTISGTVSAANGAGVPYALLTAFDTNAGVTIGGVTNPDGTYSLQLPPGNYQLYAEPLNGAIPMNLYLTAAQLAQATGTAFHTTFFNGNIKVTASQTATANIAVASNTSTLLTPFVAVSAVNASVPSAVQAGPATTPSGGQVDLVFAGAGFDATLSNSNFAVYGPGISLQPNSVRVDTSQSLNGYHLLRVTLNVVAVSSPSLASVVVTVGSNVLSLSGALIIVPPTPTFAAAGVVSAAPYTGVPSGVSPGGIYSIYDIPNVPNLGPANYVQNGGYNAYGSLPTLLAGVSVTFDGIPAPMFLAWGNQLNFQVPFELAGRSTTKVVVNYYGSASAAVTVPVLASEPSFFTSDGKAVIAYNRPSYTINSASNPAPYGSLVEIYGTGVGKVSYTINTGQGAAAPPAGYTGNYTFSVGGSAPAPALYGGWTTGAVGLAQWDLIIPSGIPTGAVSVIVKDANGVASPSTATIYVSKN